MSTEGSFATAINCIDGRTQDAVTKFMRQRFGVQYVDMVTEAGVDGALCKGEYELTESVKKKVGISVTKHHAKAIVIAGHHDCAGNPVTKDEHFAHIKKAVELVEVWGFGVPVLGVYVNDHWQIEQVVG